MLPPLRKRARSTETRPAFTEPQGLRIALARIPLPERTQYLSPEWSEGHGRLMALQRREDAELNPCAEGCGAKWELTIPTG